MQALKSFFNYRVPLFLNLILVAGIVILVAGNVYLKEPAPQTQAASVIQETEESPLTIVRKHNFRLIQPLLVTESSKESVRLAPLKNSLQRLIDQYHQQGMISSASVYFMDLNSNNWFSINGHEKYTPGSLVKVPVIMTYMKESEQKTGWLDNRMYFDPAQKGIPHQTYEIDPLVPGQSYPIRDLLRRIATTSDNNSTALVNEHINRPLFTKLFEDLDLVIPELDDRSYKTSVTEYSRFLLVLFNSSWLNEQNSELVLQWLSASTFNDGLTKNLPSGLTVARKFGEFGVGSDKQWHESGIIYLDNRPYLMTVMTHGFDNEKLRQVISELSKAAYDYYQRPL